MKILRKIGDSGRKVVVGFLKYKGGTDGSQKESQKESQKKKEKKWPWWRTRQEKEEPQEKKEEIALGIDGKVASCAAGASDASSSLRTRRYKFPSDAIQELYQGFNTWSVALATYGIHAAYALIAANWAVHGSTNAILANPLAKASLAVVAGFLGLNLLCTGLMTWLYKRRCMYADQDKERWKDEFEQVSVGPSPWPYTHLIQGLGEFMRVLRIFAPSAGGVLFILSLFFGAPSVCG